MSKENIRKFYSGVFVGEKVRQIPLIFFILGKDVHFESFWMEVNLLQCILTEKYLAVYYLIREQLWILFI